ncbi:hypothetical protein [Jannaschia sp. W003]|uniref:hypothetical protein n=1 Tax=Jannaschia sp. W003 TaxID=2867012 RepID=UPI0021A763FB|nr:hypothetical protein [Jannaschia sp. W003]UWQ21112.1 hypothetical protein K3554_14220 [Jannaschia sp. W003]
MSKTLVSAAALLLLAGPALADAHMADMTSFDANADSMLDMDEFGQADAEMGFAAYDSDADGILSEEEFSEYEMRRDAAMQMGMDDADGDMDEDEEMMGFGAYDLDASGDVSMDEFNEAEFARFDANADGMLDADEYTAYSGERTNMTMEDGEMESGTDG